MFYVQYKMQNRPRRLGLHGALFDYGHRQIPGQSQSEQLHFGHFHIFILKWKTWSQIRIQSICNITVERWKINTCTPK